EFELWLLNEGHPEFVPLPKWNPANPVPDEFGGMTGAGGTDIDACVASFTENPPVVPGGTACTTGTCATSDFVGICTGSPKTAATSPLPASFVFDYPGGPRCSRYTDIEAVRILDDFEGDYHGRVHCGVFPHSSTMCDVKVSPASLIFLPWHAFLDDVALDYECKCLGSCSTCTDLFAPFSPNPTLLASQQNDRGHGHGHGHGHQPRPPAAALPNIGFWWWFEDQVTPPVVTPPFITDHSPFHFRGNVRSKPKLVPGLVGQAIELDGTDDFIVADEKTAGDIGTQSFTIDTWVKTSAAGLQPIVAKLGDGDDDEDDGDDDHDNHRGWGFWRWPMHGRRHHHQEKETGYALYIQDGQLGLSLATADHQDTFVTTGPSIADGAWHHVAAIVDRSDSKRSRLLVDGVVVVTFDATPFAGDATTPAQLRIGQLDVQASAVMRRHHHEIKAFFKGQIDELSLVRSALPPDMVASVFVAGSAGKFGSLGNLPTTAGQAPCITVIGQRINALPAADAAPLNVLYAQLLVAIASGHRIQARQIASEIGDQAAAGSDGTYLTVKFHAVMHEVEACLDVPPLSPPQP
ncbi:MAG TPA: LamG domain-containing protein, partial [Polyangia bacterium]|nr:LamG domain-containing protein [Polyangia bacterium]